VMNTAPRATGAPAGAGAVPVTVKG